jgi:hypothetical protein
VSEGRQELKLSEAGQMLLDECRMILPGIQAIFGFQLIAVFNNRFKEDLGPFEQELHMLALALVALAAAIIMTPAAYHRQHEQRHISSAFIRLSSRLLLASMLPLAAGLAIDFYLIARMILGAGGHAPLVAGAVFTVLAFLWFVFPHAPGLHRLVAGGEK